MDQFSILQEQLRRYTWMGDINRIQELVNLGININARYSTNGWTPLHLACKKNNLDTVIFLLKNGADQNIKTDKGETPAMLTTNSSIVKLLDSLPKNDTAKISNSHETNFAPNIKNISSNCKTNLELSQQSLPNICQGEIVLKLRIADANDTDFIEVDIPCSNLTYPNLIKICCDELEINAAQIVKLRKLPNTRIRRNKDVQRLENYQEIEVVLYKSIETDDSIYKCIEYKNGNTLPITPTNNYQSISKKDQTILY